jgi:DNA polymerase III subunit epsilon
MPIEPSAIAVHGITLEDIKDAPSFNELAKNLARELEGCDLAGFNLNKFDLPLLVEEFLRAGVEFVPHKRRIIDVHVIFQKMEQRTLSAAYRFYCQKELTNAHSAEADTLATYEVLKAQLDRYDGTAYKDQSGVTSTPVINDVDQLAKFSSHTNNADYAGRIVFDDKGNECFNFGKYKGMKVEDVFEKDPSYYSWMQNGDFPLFTKNLLTAIKLRKMKK